MIVSAAKGPGDWADLIWRNNQTAQSAAIATANDRKKRINFFTDFNPLPQSALIKPFEPQKL